MFPVKAASPAKKAKMKWSSSMKKKQNQKLQLKHKKMPFNFLNKLKIMT